MNLANNDKELAREQFNKAVDLVSNMELTEEAYLKKEVERIGELLAT